jgi:large subunit ribosomal protein L20
MARVKRSVASRKRRRRVLKAVRGHRGARSRQYRAAHEELLRARQYAWVGRRLRRRDLRRLWIMRINAAARLAGSSYRRLMSGLRKAGVTVDRKILADLAVNQPAAFQEFVKTAQAAG